jgi:hypothetical protein
MRRRRSSEIIAGRVNADGSIAAGDGFTVAKGTTGNYVVTLTSGFRIVSVTISSLDGTKYVVPFSIAERTFNVSSATYVGAVSDTAFSLTVIGVQQ